ncbi:pyruvate dehydrogenase E1 component beta subunit [Candidatus Hakubella thermalkaliphila]|uniref:Pyruvate dehydrogenase E1 component beta subunit n=2 Tax=Candidatus Hakubella thermalkaliphila TaxID=2754717 RepID=A0A6V8P7A7_9ACTN|nr:pyruvate dehydrogenase E1 component beta subunit [Candidatus Hakubella thermalkaliphila]GFP27870.1 pyruvate dehydrogenase E1 component beta subunit [Candidatus Hakubella thermalkaliphila]GFP34249.1 pyruvate dehydrogenase E1 component beta subunit [Candidatus Hakubella thermalkaliphila]GFP42677.1 pyruvate dehydrogenase E1 component beta subunit [Candidatus Hakubella thermalkaliphila]
MPKLGQRGEIIMREITYSEAIREALRQEMKRDERVFLMGEDIGLFGGSFGVTRGLIDEFGKERVRDTPISEAAIAGAATGAAVAGMRPVAEIMFSDFTTIAMDQLVNQTAKIRYQFGGKARVPMVLRTPTGAGTGAAAQHSQTVYNWFVHVPGLIVVAPSTPRDAKGLLISAIRNDNPVLFFEHKLLYSFKGEVPEEEYTIPLGVGEVKREGKDVTVFATSIMVHKALKVAEELEEEGISVEVVDPRTLKPLDEEILIQSVRKTSRLVVVDEGPRSGGFAAEAVAVAVEGAFDYLDAPVQRVTAPDTPVPYSLPLEKAYIPDEGKIRAAIQRTLK